MNARASLIDMAQKWLELAGAHYGNQVFRDVIGEFNQRQLLDIDRPLEWLEAPSSSLD